MTPIDLDLAHRAFASYLADFDTSDPKIALKVRHTYAVERTSAWLAEALDLGEEDRDLADLIGLLHDIGRFRQLTLFNSFDDRNVSHAACGLEVLFDQGHIRDFVATDQFDDVIRLAIRDHSLLAIQPDVRGRALLHARLIRDSDKLDNFRVKACDPVEAMLDESAAQLGSEPISDNVYQAVLDHRPIRREERRTKIDMWVSYLAFVFDLNFAPSYDFILDGDYVRSNVERIPCSNPQTAERMAVIGREVEAFCRQGASRESEQGPEGRSDLEEGSVHGR